MIDPKSIISSVIKTNTLRQTLITLSGTLITGIFGFIFYIIVARNLGPGLYGTFSVAVTFLGLIAGISDVGTNTGIIRFAAKLFRSDREKALRFLKLGFEIKVLSWLVVLTVGLLTLPWISNNLLQKPELAYPLRFSILGVGGFLLFSFATYAVQALEKFWVWSGLNILINFLRLTVVILLIYLGIFSLKSGLLVFIIFPFLGFLTGLFFIPNFFIVKKESKLASEFFRYNKWVALFTLIAAISSRVDTFIATRLLSLHDVGIYSVATSLSSVVPQIVFALAVVVAPKLASFDSKDKALDYLIKLQLFTIGLSVLGLIIGIPLSRFLVPALYGASYTSSTTPLIVLLVAQAIFLISVPAHTSVFYYFSYPKLFVWISLGHLMIVGGAGWILISRFGVLGAAVAVLLGNLFNFVTPFVWVFNKFRRKL